MSCRVLYVEDEEHLAVIVRETMELKGYTVRHLKNGLKILDTIADFKPDICVLDVMLPYVDGFTLGMTIHKAFPRMPVIFLTARDQTADVLTGLSSGGTDYIRKPFSMEELMARIDVQVRLAANRDPAAAQDQHPPEIRLGSFIYYPSRLELKGPAGSFRLSNREAEILNVFCLRPNAVVDRRELMRMVWQDDSYFISRNLDVYIRRLRDYFAGGTGVEIITLKGKGYHFSVS